MVSSAATTTTFDSQSQQQTTIFGDTTANTQSSPTTPSVQCTACTKPIVSCFDACLHPLLSVIVCKSCHDQYGDGDFSIFEEYADSFGDENYCRWCVDGGELLVCGIIDDSTGKKCHYAFCKDCIKRNLASYEMPKPNLAFPYVCFACDPSPLENLRKESLEIIKQMSREQPLQTGLADESDDSENTTFAEQKQDQEESMEQDTAAVAAAISLTGPPEQSIQTDSNLAITNTNMEHDSDEDMDTILDDKDVSSESDEQYLDTMASCDLDLTRMNDLNITKDKLSINNDKNQHQRPSLHNTTATIELQNNDSQLKELLVNKTSTSSKSSDTSTVRPISAVTTSQEKQLFANNKDIQMNGDKFVNEHLKTNITNTSDDTAEESSVNSEMTTLDVTSANLSDNISTNGECLNPTRSKRTHDKLDADAYFKHLKKDDLAYLNFNPRVFDSEELTKLLNNIKENKRLITDHHSNFFDRLMEECQACIDGHLDPCNGRVLLTLLRDQSFIEVKNLLIMYRKIDSLIESLPID